MNLFVYGQLTVAARLFELLGRLPATRVAVLDGYSRRVDPASSLFAAHPAAGAEIAGLLLLNLEPEELQRLDAYEGVAEGEYCRKAVSVRVLEPPAQLLADTYLAGSVAR